MVVHHWLRQAALVADNCGDCSMAIFHGSVIESTRFIAGFCHFNIGKTSDNLKARLKSDGPLIIFLVAKAGFKPAIFGL